MSKNRKLTRLVRERMAKTGENYTTALRRINEAEAKEQETHDLR